MRRERRYIGLMGLMSLMGFMGLMGLMGCSMIDEDQSDCDQQARIDYELRLVTNMETEIETQLNTESEQDLANELRQFLSGIFTDFAHDVDLSFYDTVGDSIRLQHDQHIMDANQATYTLNLPMRQYMHLAAANLVNNQQVSLVSDEFCHPSMLQQVTGDTVASHTTGLFTARQPMDVLGSVDQNFDVRLYMANCAAVLVVDPRDVDPSEMAVYTTGFATGYHICDSSYVFGKSPIVNTSLVGNAVSGQPFAFCSVTFPSKPGADTRTVIETEEPFISQEGDETLWEFRVYVPEQDVASTRGHRPITETILRLKKRLKAGQLFILKGWLDRKGIFYTKDKTVGVSVTLDWNKNQEQDVPL